MKKISITLIALFFLFFSLTVTDRIFSKEHEDKEHEDAEVYGKVVLVNSSNNYINIEGAGENISVLITGSTEIKYNGKKLSLNDIRNGDILKVEGLYIDKSIMAYEIEVISRAESQESEVYAVTHNASGILKPGNILTVTVYGTTQGKAHFEIEGLTGGISMKEISDGRYEGSYTIKSGDFIENAYVTGYIVMPDGSTAKGQATDRVTIEAKTDNLVTSTVIPEENSTEINDRPDILIVIDSNKSKGIIPQTAVLKVNGKDVTSKASVDKYVISYLPSSSLSSGLNTVNFEAIDYDGQKVYKEWSFYVGKSQEGNIIYSVSHNGGSGLSPGDILTVTMIGHPGGYGTFDIDNLKTGIYMAEYKNNPGVYTGEYTVTKNDMGESRYIICHLEVTGKGEEKFIYNQPVIFEGTLQSGDMLNPPQITDPKNGNKIKLPLVVKGKTEPYYNVKITVKADVEILGVIKIGGESHTEEVTANSNGKFEAVFDFLVSNEGTRYTITAIAVNSNGEQSTETTVIVYQK